jgi:hypothetical protein
MLADWLIKNITIAEGEADNPGISDDRVSRFPKAVELENMALAARGAGRG